MSSCPDDVPVPNNELGRFGVEMIEAMHHSMEKLSIEVAELKLTVKLSAQLQEANDKILERIEEGIAVRNREGTELRRLIVELRNRVDAIRDTVASIPDKSST